MLEIIGSVIGVCVAASLISIIYSIMKSVINTKPSHMKQEEYAADKEFFEYSPSAYDSTKRYPTPTSVMM